MVKFGLASLFFWFNLAVVIYALFLEGDLIVFINSPSYDFKICLITATSR